jgi:hypothetical protein
MSDHERLKLILAASNRSIYKKHYLVMNLLTLLVLNNLQPASLEPPGRVTEARLATETTTRLATEEGEDYESPDEQIEETRNEPIDEGHIIIPWSAMKKWITLACAAGLPPQYEGNYISKRQSG